MYQPDETIRLEVRVEDETVWLTQQQMAELFLTTKQNVSLHVNNIFREDELTESSVVKESLTTARDGKRYKTKVYNLDGISGSVLLIIFDSYSTFVPLRNMISGTDP